MFFYILYKILKNILIINTYKNNLYKIITLIKLVLLNYLHTSVYNEFCKYFV